MFTFIPKLATKAAWDTKPFSSARDLPHIVELMKRKDKFLCQGHISFRDFIDTDMRRIHVFSGVAELQQYLAETLQWKPDTIHSVFFFHLGHFLKGKG